MKEMRIETPTTLALMADKEKRAKGLYVFELTESEVVAVRNAGLPDSALAALAAIRGAAFGVRSTEWVTLPARTLSAFGRTYRWWARATRALEAAGLIEALRHNGRAPRYRLVSPTVRPRGGPGV